MIKFQGIGAQGNYSQAGKAVADDTLRSFLAARRNSPNYGDMAITAADIRKKEKLATLKNQAEVAATRLTADADVKAKKMGIEAKSSLNTAKRKAGALGLAGQLFGKISDAGGEKPLEPYKGRYSREDLQSDIDRLESEATTIKDGIVVPEKPDFSTPGLSTPSSSGGGNSATNPITPSGGDVSREEVYSYLTKDKGLSHNKAYGLMANIDRESSFRVNPGGGDGGNSVGLLQWNNTYGRSDLMQQNVPDYATNWKGQLDHALSQNQLPEYNKVTSDYLNTTFQTPQAASEYFLRKWEIPADVSGGISKNNNFIAGYNYGQ